MNSSFIVVSHYTLICCYVNKYFPLAFKLVFCFLFMLQDFRCKIYIYILCNLGIAPFANFIDIICFF